MPFLLILLLSIFGAYSARAEEKLSLDQVLSLAREKNPDISAARKAWEAAKSRVAPARAWPDPMLSLSREKFPDGERTDHLMVEQDIPFPGKKTTEGAMMRHEALIAESRYRAKALEVLAQARILYYRLYRADQLIKQLGQTVDLMKTTLRVSQSRLQAPGGSSGLSDATGMGMGGGSAMGSGSSGQMGADVFSLMAELSQMENMLFEEKQDRILVSLELNTLLNRPLDTPLGMASAPVLADLPLPLPEVLAMTGASGPMYQQAMHEERHARAMLARARLAFAPDFGVFYDRMKEGDGMRGSEAGARVSVPLWITRPLGELKEARTHRDEAGASAQAMRNEALKMTAMEFTETQTHLTLARNYQTAVLPAAESAFKLSRRQYESGGGNFLRLLESLRTYIDAQTEYHNQLYHYGEHWALLEQWVGAPLASSTGESQ
jgi:outer membrane protein TolC